MSRALRCLALGVALWLALLTAGAGLSAEAAAADRSSPAQPGPVPSLSAVETFTSCLNSARRGDLLLLIDESNSLASSDPRDARVIAARYLLSRMSTFADRTGFELDVALAGFSDQFVLHSGWTPVGESTLPVLTEQVDAFADRDRGFETDYWTALEGARRALADQATPGGERRCQAVAWFSDGELDITPRASGGDDGATKLFSGPLEITSEAAADQAEAAAAESLCAPGGGLADQLRASGVVVFGIGLDSGDRPLDFDLMRSIAAGESPSRSCGRPATRVPGEFELAADIDGLLFAFDDLIPPGPPISQERGTCPVTECTTERHGFVLDSSVGKVEILGSVDRDGVDAVLAPPSGPSIPLDPKAVGTPATFTRDRSTVTFTWLSDRTVSVDLSGDTRVPGWSGEWALVFVDPTPDSPGARSRSNIHITGDLLPEWTNPPPVLHSGDVLDADFGLVDRAGAAVEPSSVRGTLALSAVLLSPGRPSATVLSGVDKESLGEPATLDLREVPPGAATLRLTLAVRTAPALRPDGTEVPGTQLVPSSVDLPLQIAAPAGYPQVGGLVNFGASDGEKELTAVLDVTGPGCVWAAPGTAPAIDVVPPDAGAITVGATDARGPQTCLELAPGERGELELRLSTAEVGNGTVAGTLPVSIAPPGEPESARSVAVPFTADLRRALDTVVFWQVLVTLAVLGVAVPVGLLYLAKWASARVPARPLLAGVLPVTVVDGEVRGTEGPFRIGQGDVNEQVRIGPRGGRHLLADRVRLHARPGWSPFGAGHVRASVGDGCTRAASERGTVGGDALLPLAVHNSWVLLHDPAGPPDRAEVLVLVSGDDTTGRRRTELESVIAQRLPAVLARLRAQHPPPAGSPTATAAPPPFGPPDDPSEPPQGPFDLGPSGGGGPTPPTQQTTSGDHW